MAESYNEDEDRISVEQYNKEMEASEKEIESGNYHTQNQVRQTIDRWEKE